MGKFDKDFITGYQVKKPGNGVYAFVINGDFTIAGHRLNKRDGLGIWDTDHIEITADAQDAEILLIDVPMILS